MTYELIVNNDKAKGEVAVALLQDKKLVELHKEKSNNQFSVGDIYLGKVSRVMKGLNAAFVDVGYEKDAFLHYLDLGPQFKSLCKYVDNVIKGKQNSSSLMYFKPEPDINKDGKIDEVIKPGMNILVQIAKEPISAKGPRITSELSIPGRYLVLTPFNDKITISSKIKDETERDRLTNLLKEIKPKNFGLIIRTAAEGKSIAEIEIDLKDLMSKWEHIFNELKKARPPQKVLGEVDRVSAILRDLLNEQFTAIYVNDSNLYNDILNYVQTIAPEKKDIVKKYDSKLPIFDVFGIEKQIKSLFGKTVYLKSGAYLIVEHTEALHVFDVNSGNRAKANASQEENALEVNLEAAEEIARQLRLRDMGGIIVIDFIDMYNQENKKILYERLKELMKTDRAKHNILPPSKFGLVQITRQRLRPEVNIEVLETCPSCGGTGKIQPSILLVDQIEKTLHYIIAELKEKNISLAVHPYVESYLTKGIWSKLNQWRWKYKQWIKIIPMDSYTFMEYRFFNATEEEIIV
ncbi:MAG: Rne/Rng family ribonuclease [Bacteroidetes bacterium]|nr:MAG: Rne/Rng family ribonuclease [Bacteroidota bacterium]